MNIYEFDKHVQPLLAMRKERIHPARLEQYSKIVFTGGFAGGSAFDYGRGYVEVDLYCYPIDRRIADKVTADTPCQIRLVINTIDDSMAGAWSNTMPYERAQRQVDKIAEEWLKDKRVLDPIETENNLLRKYGLHLEILSAVEVLFRRAAWRCGRRLHGWRR